MKITCVGDIGVDYYENLDLYKPGGIAFNFASNLKQVGGNSVSLIGALGSDEYSKKLTKVLKSSKIDISQLQKISGETPKQNISLINGERKFTLYNSGILKKWKLRKKDLAFISKQDAVFVPLSDGMEQIFNAIKKIKGVVKIVDFSQDYEHADFDKKDNLITKNAKYFDIIFVGGVKKHEPMIKKLAKKYPEKVFVLTLGAKGSVAFYQEQYYFQSAKKVKVVDTTGAGDAFQAGFTATYLKSKNVKQSLTAGANQAVKVIKIIGSTDLAI